MQWRLLESSTVDELLQMLKKWQEHFAASQRDTHLSVMECIDGVLFCFRILKDRDGNGYGVSRDGLHRLLREAYVRDAFVPISFP